MGEALYKRILCISKKKAALWLMLVLLTLPHMKTPYLARIPATDMLFNVWRVASFAGILAQLLFVKRKISIISLVLIVQQIYLFVVTLINDQDAYSCAVTAFSVISVVLLYDNKQYEKKVFLSSQLFCFELIVYINLFTELLYPDGMYVANETLFVAGKNWFLGFYNNHSQYYIPALMFAWLYYKTTGKKLRTGLLTAGIFAAAFRVWSGGVLLSLFCMTLVYVFLKNRTRIFNYYTYWTIHVFFFIFIVELKLQNMFQWLIDGILGKWGSFLTRMNLWDRAKELVMEAPIFGHGIVDGTARELEAGFNYAMHAHNMLLEILYKGGVINLALWVVIVIIGGKRVYQYRNTDESKIISIAFLGWCVATLVEPFTTPFLVGMFVIAYRSDFGELVGSDGDRLRK